MLKQIKQRGDSKLARTLRQELDGLRACSGGIRKWRNRRIAHTDLPTALLLHPDPLPGIRRELVDEALERVRNLMNKIEKHYADSETEYEHVIQEGDGKALLVWLQAGLAHEDEERKEHGLSPRYAALMGD